VADSAQRFGDHEFIVTPEGRLTFAELDRRSRVLAAAWWTPGCRRGAGWPCCSPTGRPGSPAGWPSPGWDGHRPGQHLLQGLRAGSVPAPLRRLVPDRHAPLLAPRLRPAPGGGGPELVGQDPGACWRPPCPSCGGVLLGRVAGRLGAGRPRLGPRCRRGAGAGRGGGRHGGRRRPADPMMLMYTSGSTAIPRGCCTATAHDRHATNLAARSAWDATIKLWTPMPFFWVGGFHTMMFRALVSGATVVTQDALDPAQALQVIEAERSPTSWPGRPPPCRSWTCPATPPPTSARWSAARSTRRCPRAVDPTTSRWCATRSA